MSVRDYKLDDTVEVLGSGDGWSIWRSIEDYGIRVDCWGGDNEGRYGLSVPGIRKDEDVSKFVLAAVDAIRYKAAEQHELAGPVNRLAKFVQERWPHE